MIANPFYELDREDRVVVIRCKGEWTRQTGLDLFVDLERLIDQLEPGVPWATLVDFRQWLPPNAEIVAQANDAKALVEGAGRGHGAFLVESLEAVKMLIETSVVQPESKRVRYFQSEQAARQWLASLGYLDS